MLVNPPSVVRSSERRERGRRSNVPRMAKGEADRQAASALKHKVGARLALARESIGLTQSQLAKEYCRIGVTPPKLNQWEGGKYYPEAFFLVCFCDDYGFTMDWFYRGTRAGVSSERADGLRRAQADTAAE